MYDFPFVFLAMLTFIKLKSSVPIDNRLAGDPEVRCGVDGMTIAISTFNPFEGNFYVKGRFNDTGCKIYGNGDRQAMMQLSYSGGCGVRRRRQVSPLGMTIDATVVVMFHKLVLTKVDRAFNIQCFYMQGEKIVTANLEVSMLSTLILNSNVRMPNCVYQVLQGGPTGQAIRYAQIGDAVYHKWTCTGGDSQMFCITVHSCFVDDGQGQNLLLLDSNGCGQDKYLLQHLEYLSDTMAGRESHVFKFADKPTLYFSCQIRLTVKEASACVRPQCPELQKGKRSVRDIVQDAPIQTDIPNMDVSSNALTILEIEGESADEKVSFFQQPNQALHPMWCLSPTTAIVFACLIGTLTLVCLALLVAVAILKMKSQFLGSDK